MICEYYEFGYILSVYIIVIYTDNNITILHDIVYHSLN